MSSLLNWDGSQTKKNPEDEEKEDATGSSAPNGNLSASAQQADLTHGSNLGSSSLDNAGNIFNNGTHATPTTSTRASDSTLNGALSPSRISKRPTIYSSKISFGSALNVHATVAASSSGPQAQATVPQALFGPSVLQASVAQPGDSSAEASSTNAATITENAAPRQSMSPVARVPPRVRRLSTQDSPSSDTLQQATTALQNLAVQAERQERQHSPPWSQPSPSRTPQGYMEVDEDGEGSPVVPTLDVAILSPGVAADEDAVEAAMVVDRDDDEISNLRYPSHTSSVSDSKANDAQNPANRPLLSLNGKPNVLPDTPPPEESLARPASPTLDIIFGSQPAGPSLSPPPPPRKKEPLFLSPTPSDEISSGSPVPGPPLFKPGHEYPKPRAPSDDIEVVEDAVMRKGKGKGKEKQKPTTAKKPIIGGGNKAGSTREADVFKTGPPKKKGTRRIIESSQSAEENEEPIRQRSTGIKKPTISGPKDNARGESSNVKSKAPVAKTKTKRNIGPKSRVSSDDTISITSDSEPEMDVRRKRLPRNPARTQEDESYAPVQSSRRRAGPSKRAPSPSSSDDSKPEVVAARSESRDSDIEFVDDVRTTVPKVGKMKVFVEVPRMPRALRVVVKRDRAREAEASASAQASSSAPARTSTSAVPVASSSKPRPRPVKKKTAVDVSMDIDIDPSAPPQPSSSRPHPRPSALGQESIEASVRPLDNSTERNLADDLNAAMAANARIDSDSDDDVPLGMMFTQKSVDKGKDRRPLVEASNAKKHVPLASASAPPGTAKKPRIGLSAPSTSAMRPPTSTSRILAPASSSRMPPPALPASASAPLEQPGGSRAGAGQLNDPPCNSCAAAGGTDCVNGVYPHHRKCTRCQDQNITCSFLSSRGRAGSVASSRAGSATPSRRKSLAAGRAQSVVSTRDGSVVPRAKGTKRVYDGIESVSKKRKMEDMRSSSKPRASSVSTNTIAGPSWGRLQAGPSKTRVLSADVISIADSGADRAYTKDDDDDDDDDGPVDYVVPPNTTRIFFGKDSKVSLCAPLEGGYDPSRGQWISKYMKDNENAGSSWRQLMRKNPKISRAVLDDATFGDEGDWWSGGEDEDGAGKGGGSGMGGGGGDGGRGEGGGAGSGGGAGQGKGKQKEDQGRRGDGGRANGKQRADEGKGKQRADIVHQANNSKQARDTASLTSLRNKDGSPRRKTGPKPKYKSNAPQSELTLHAPSPRHPVPSNATHINLSDPFQPPVVSLTSATATTGIPEAQHLLAVINRYESSRQASTMSTPAVSTPTLAPPPPGSGYVYYGSPQAQHSESTAFMQQIHADSRVSNPYHVDYPLMIDDNHGHFYPGRSPVLHRDFHSEGGTSMNISEGSFAAAFTTSDAAFSLAEGSHTHTGSFPPNSDQEVSNTLGRDGQGSTDSSQTVHTSGRSHTIDPAVLGGASQFPSVTDDDQSPTKSRPESSRDSEYESEPEPPAHHGHSSDDDYDFVPSKVLSGPSKRNSMRAPKATLKRKATLPPSESEDVDVVEIPADPTKVFKGGSRGIQWPKGTVKQSCHQCRRSTMRRHVTCSSGKLRTGGGVHRCVYAYCEGCLVTRYGDAFLGLLYDGTDDFRCPVCRGLCNCTTCTRKRGEKYMGVQKKRRNTLSIPRAKKSANYGPKSVVSKRRHAVQADFSASPTPRAVKRIRLILPEPPKTPPPPEPWIPPKMTYQWPAGVKTELFAPDGLPCGYMWVNEEGQCMTTYTREVILPGVDADGELYWDEADVTSSSSSSSEDEEDDDSAYEEPPVRRPPPPRPKGVRRWREYAGARPLPPPTVKKLWFPHSRKFKFSPDEPDYSGRQGAYVGERPPKVKEGPLRPELLHYLENYDFEKMAQDPVPDEVMPAAAPEPGHLADEDEEDIPELPTPPRSSSADIDAPAPMPTFASAVASALEAQAASPSADAILSSFSAVAPEVNPIVGEKDEPPSQFTDVGNSSDNLDKERDTEKDKVIEQWTNDFTRPQTDEITSPAPAFATTSQLKEFLHRLSSTPAPA